MKKSCEFDHEKINLVEKNVGTPAIKKIIELRAERQLGHY
jgi:hypothetical protein